jgi:radical SAM superfamily enzyme YgiQ (UPF0313 family)
LRVLLVYPQYPDTFWSFKHALRVVAKKAAFPPLGLATVAAMLPRLWEMKLTDMNVRPLKDDDIRWADYVFISAMAVQRASVDEVIKRCKKLDTPTVAGGPLFTEQYDEFDEVDHLVLNEAEVTLPLFLEDLEKGCARHVYSSQERPDIRRTPLPKWSLVDMNKYSSMAVQYSRGCPYNCEFCDIIILNGNVPRTKGKEQIVAELDALYRRGWREGIFIVDDNFIGNKKKLKSEVLPAIIEWQKPRKYPSMLLTEASMNLADDEELMDLMVEAGFETVFVGIESPNEDSLAECSKQQNRGRDLVASVKTIQNHGLQVQGGFILGFDNDPASIFRSQINFIQNSGIVTAMVGLLNAPRGTRLYQRLKSEDRLLDDFSGDNTDCSMNFTPKMDRETLMNGYRQILDTIYSPKEYYRRVKVFLSEYKPKRKKRLSQVHFWHLWAFARLVWVLGVWDRYRIHYWRFFLSTLFKRPRHFPLSMTFAVYGFHFRHVVSRLDRPPIHDSTA